MNIKFVYLALLGLLSCGGCKTVVRENMLSSVQTGIGGALAQNPQTQLYEVRVGFFRSQFYSVPTGKRVEPETGQGSASETAQVVSGIRSSTSFKNLLVGADVSESFAVGSVAVLSPAAVAMYVSQAPDAQTARAAEAAVRGLKPTQNYSEDVASVKLQDFVDNDPQGQARLHDWLEARSGDGSQWPLLLSGDDPTTVSLRAKAVMDLLGPQPTGQTETTDTPPASGTAVPVPATPETPATPDAPAAG